MGATRLSALDEPSGNLDSHNAVAMLDIFCELNASGLTILMVTHNPELLRQARRIITPRDRETSDNVPENRAL
jgi:putative ABC transport system ATP-binding protein